MLTDQQFTQYAEAFIPTVYRVALNYIGSQADAEDVTQNVFCKLLGEDKPFSGSDHVRNGLIRVTINECKNLKKSRWWRQESLEDHLDHPAFDTPKHSQLYDAVMALPRKYRLPIYLHYYEGYSTQEIGEILKLPKNTVCSQLRRGREQLKQFLQEVDEYV